MHYPERLREGEDVQDDVTAVDGKPAQHMNQSVFSMIAAAGSRVDFHARFDEESSDSEGDQGNSEPRPSTEPRDATRDAEGVLDDVPGKSSVAPQAKKHNKVLGKKGSPTFPKLNLKTIKERNYM